MTPEQVALYGGALWVGPLFLLGWVVLIWWLRNGPITERGKRKIAAQNARHEARARELWPEAFSQDSTSITHPEAERPAGDD